jgi:hypothetical protein
MSLNHKLWHRVLHVRPAFAAVVVASLLNQGRAKLKRDFQLLRLAAAMRELAAGKLDIITALTQAAARIGDVVQLRGHYSCYCGRRVHSSGLPLALAKAALM